jgi:hypothetical protein
MDELVLVKESNPTQRKFNMNFQPSHTYPGQLRWLLTLKWEGTVFRLFPETLVKATHNDITSP